MILILSNLFIYRLFLRTFVHLQLIIMRYLLTFFILVFCTIGFAQTKYQVLKDTTDSSSIVHKIQEIPEVEIRSKNPLSHIKSSLGGVFIDIPTLKKLPSILGDSDPFKALQYMGGMSQAGDASANIHVRGGENDQNLILLNGIPMENPTHILGLFSVFNPDLIDQIQYIKSGIPAEYGGRLSSVIDVKNFINPPPSTELTGNLGIIASRLSLKSNIGDKFSYYAAARASYIQFAIIPLLLKLGIDPQLAQNGFEYYDINVGFNYNLGAGTKLSMHYYKGEDRVKVQALSQFAFEGNNSQWGNHIIGLQLSHLFSDKFSMLHYLNYSGFQVNSKMDWLANLYLINTDKSTYNYKSDYIFIANKHLLKAGIEASFGKQLPAIIKTNDGMETDFQYNQSLTTSVYLRDEWEQGPLLLNAGLRTSLHHKFSQIDEIGESNLDEAYHAKSYLGLEPRLFSRLMLSEESSLKLSVSKHFQYTNSVQLINFGLPLEIFMASSAQIKPASLWHFSGGYFRSIDNNNWEVSAEAYYKSFSNLLEFGGSLNDLFTVSNLEELMHSGIGYAYGTELMLRKNFGKFAGWMNYNLGWNYRQFSDINEGKRYLANNDRRHDLTLVGMYNLSPKLSLSASFSFATGNRLNLPRSWLIIDDKVVFEYDGYNAFRMPNYHRLDVSLSYKLPKWHQIDSELNFSIYNVYNRANPFEVHYSNKDAAHAYDYNFRMTYLTPILPSFSWTFQLK